MFFFLIRLYIRDIILDYSNIFLFFQISFLRIVLFFTTFYNKQLTSKYIYSKLTNKNLTGKQKPRVHHTKSLVCLISCNQAHE